MVCVTTVSSNAYPPHTNKKGKDVDTEMWRYYVEGSGFLKDRRKCYKLEPIINVL